MVDKNFSEIVGEIWQNKSTSIEDKIKGTKITAEIEKEIMKGYILKSKVQKMINDLKATGII